MKLIEARIDGYGELNDRSIGLDAPVIVVYGPNEAGKSTLFGFLRTMLYGFPRRSSPGERHEPAGGGRHGGRLVFADAQGFGFLLERYAAIAGGKPKVKQWQRDNGEKWLNDTKFGTERVLEQAAWEGQFLGGVQERLYRQLFAITLSELMEVGTLSGGELGRYLYQAGWEEGRAVAAAEKRIQAEMDELFKPKGTNQRLIGYARTIESLDAELRGLEDGIDRFNELTREGETTERELAALEGAVPAAEERVRLLRKAVKARPIWLRGIQLRAEMERLSGAGHLAADASSVWDDLQGRRGLLKEEAVRLRKELEQAKGRMRSLTYDETLLARCDELEAMLQGSERIRGLSMQVSEWRVELESLDEAIAKLVTAISPEWTERQLRELMVTVADKDDVREVRERMLVMQRKEEKLGAECEGLQARHLEAQALLEETATALRLERLPESAAGGDGIYSLLELTPTGLAQAWSSVDEALRAWELEQARQQSASPSADAVTKEEFIASGGARTSWLPWGISGLGAAALLAAGSLAGLLGDLSDGALAAALLIGGASAALLVAGRLSADRGADRANTRGESDRGSRLAGRSGKSGNNRGWSAATGGNSDSAETASAAEERLERALGLLVKDPSAVLSALIDRSAGRTQPEAKSALQAIVGATGDHLARKERLVSRMDEHEARLSRIRAMLDEREAAMAIAVAETSQAAAEWRSWLTARALPESLSPTAALETFELAEGAMDRLRQYDRLSAKIAAADRERSDYVRHAVALCEGYAEWQRQAAQDPVLALTLLQGEYRRQAASRSEELSLASQAAEMTEQLSHAESALSIMSTEIGGLLEAAGAATEEQYETALHNRVRLGEWEGEYSLVQIELTAGQSPERLAQLEELWTTCDELLLDQSLREAELEAARLSELQQSWLERRGRVKQAMEHLTSAEKRGELLSKRSMAVSALEADSSRYAVLSVSRALIRATRKKFEEERQPSVLRHASAYMRLLSEGRYVRVHAGGPEAGIGIERSDGIAKDSGLLSRGTAEQLYLSMRLALAREATGPVKLPMLLDDLFVNFDRARLHAASALMNEIASERQIILFTCHEHVRDAMLAGCRAAVTVDMTPQQATTFHSVRNSGTLLDGGS
ncbi:AAA family ATPase [Paenibacillus agaridevorans]|uniref:AAA family ATPase n=1 Tax=Paenibacillus agaridevorans TaxID=171404 RepID=UPI001BE3F7B3|nr:AAA family ATPase [Paenibacillus agaridevorans]